MKRITYQIPQNQIENYFSDIETVRKIIPNIKLNNFIQYEYLRSLIYFHVLSKIKKNKKFK